MFRLSLLSLFSFLSTLIFAQPVQQDIAALLEQNQSKLGITPEDLAEYKITNSYTTAHLNITHVYIEQRFRDIRVFNGILNLNLLEDRLVSFGNRWISGMSAKAPSHLPDITPASAVTKAADHLGHNFSNPIEIQKEQNKLGQDTKVVFDRANLSRENIEAELVWLKVEEKNVLLCWKVQIYEIDNENIWDIFIDAHTGEFIRKDNLVMHC